MPRFIALMIAAVIGAFLGSLFRPGPLEILIVACVLTGVFAIVNSARQRQNSAS
jgi:hypothetical protein